MVVGEASMTRAYLAVAKRRIDEPEKSVWEEGMKHRAMCVGLILLALATTVSAEEWPGWRGPRGDGTSEETNLPTRWSKTENVAWKVPIPGKGHSSPVI